ncbi:MAG TPA: hypothetical protein VFT30_02130 [Nitrospira sp.]|nr:hypothetical protein [Nitrospira sp.]
MKVEYIIPFRDRGIDQLRHKNLMCVTDYWRANGVHWPHVCTDGRAGDAQFNRSAAYNFGVRNHDADVYVFTESDMIVPKDQIDKAIEMAVESPGLVVPFTLYCYLAPDDSALVRADQIKAHTCSPVYTKENGRSIGAVNVVSRETMEMVGKWDENFEGNWYDDDAMKRAFDVAAAKTRWVEGPAYHLYHMPGWKGEHLTDEDRAATKRNKKRYLKYRQATTPEQIRKLTSGGS